MTPQEKKEKYIQELEAKVLDKLGENLTTRFETCSSAPAWGWSVEEHLYMPTVAHNLR